MEFRVVAFNSESFSLLKRQDVRRIATAIVVKKILLLRIGRLTGRRGLDKDDHIFKRAVCMD